MSAALAKKPDTTKLTSTREAEKELERLATKIAEHDRRYYQEDAPVVSDADYDALRHRNDAIEDAFSAACAPRQSAACASARSLRRSSPRSSTRVPMLSLDNAFDDEDVVDFAARVRRFLGLKEDDELDVHRRAEDRRAFRVAAL